MSDLTLLKVMTLDGETISEQFVDGRIQSLSMSDSGEMFLTKRVKGEDSIVYRYVINNEVCIYLTLKILSEFYLIAFVVRIFAIQAIGRK